MKLLSFLFSHHAIALPLQVTSAKRMYDKMDEMIKITLQQKKFLKNLNENTHTGVFIYFILFV